jgi:hypothetical protein
MTHLSEEQQILAHYGEPLEPPVLEHLLDCGECRAMAQDLTRLLGVADDDPVPEPEPGYEARLWGRLQWQLRGLRATNRRWLLPAAAAALLVTGFLGGRLLSPREVSPAIAGSSAISSSLPAKVSTPSQPPVAMRPSTLLATAARQQVDRSSRLLIDVANHAHDADLTDTRDAAEELLVTNRLYRVAAKRSGADQVADLLDEIEPILLELSHTEPKAMGGELSRIQQRIHSRQLLFKLRVISSTLRTRAQKIDQAGPRPSNVTKL